MTGLRRGGGGEYLCKSTRVGLPSFSSVHLGIITCHFLYPFQTWLLKSIRCYLYSDHNLKLYPFGAPLTPFPTSLSHPSLSSSYPPPFFLLPPPPFILMLSECNRILFDLPWYYIKYAGISLHNQSQKVIAPEIEKKRKKEWGNKATDYTYKGS